MLVVIEITAMAAICLFVQPEHSSLDGIYLLGIYVFWMSLPTLTATIGALNHRRRTGVTLAAMLASVACWGGLLVITRCFDQHLGIVRDAPFSLLGLVLVHAGFGLCISIIWLGFVQVILYAVAHFNDGPSKIKAGVKKGAAFGGLCSFVAAALVYTIGPPTSDVRSPATILLRQEIERNYSIASLATLLIGTLTCILLGALIARVHWTQSAGGLSAR
jgi:hypothetical protein